MHTANKINRLPVEGVPANLTVAAPSGQHARDLVRQAPAVAAEAGR
jgi:hypothetical protein